MKNKGGKDIMLNVKTLIKRIYNDSRYFYKQEIEDYHVFTDARIMIFIKKTTNEELYKELSLLLTQKTEKSLGFHHIYLLAFQNVIKLVKSL